VNIDTYSIQEASERANVSKHTLRFWERELNGIIVPLRTNGRQRRYTPNHLAVIEEVKNLKKKGLSLPDIKKILDHGRKTMPAAGNKDEIDLLANQIAEVVKTTLYDFLKRDDIRKKI
jgi:DNA-binding transcriptional MerR regulator